MGLPHYRDGQVFVYGKWRHHVFHCSEGFNTSMDIYFYFIFYLSLYRLMIVIMMLVFWGCRAGLAVAWIGVKQCHNLVEFVSREIVSHCAMAFCFCFLLLSSSSSSSLWLLLICFLIGTHVSFSRTAQNANSNIGRVRVCFSKYHHFYSAIPFSKIRRDQRSLTDTAKHQ